MRKALALVVLVLLVLVVGACAKRPGQGVTASFAQQWNCDHGDVMNRAESYKEGLGMTEVWIPRVGWTACELMARRGRPNDISRQEMAGRRSANWWYGSGSSRTLVSLELDGATWRVDYVGRE